jgi:hypothetical protein
MFGIYFLHLLYIKLIARHKGRFASHPLYRDLLVKIESRFLSHTEEKYKGLHPKLHSEHLREQDYVRELLKRKIL